MDSPFPRSEKEASIKYARVETAKTLNVNSRWRVPEETFFDEEEGNSRKLRLSLRWLNGTAVGRQGWIRFDETRQEVWLM